jgi:alpha-tubulin suppressor-like RCC1 family protein
MGKEKVVTASCGSDFTMVVTDKGQLFAFGSPEYGQVCPTGQPKCDLIRRVDLVLDVDPIEISFFSCS